MNKIKCDHCKELLVKIAQLEDAMSRIAKSSLYISAVVEPFNEESRKGRKNRKAVK